MERWHLLCCSQAVFSQGIKVHNLTGHDLSWHRAAACALVSFSPDGAYGVLRFRWCWGLNCLAGRAAAMMAWSWRCLHCQLGWTTPHVGRGLDMAVLITNLYSSIWQAMREVRKDFSTDGAGAFLWGIGRGEGGWPEKFWMPCSWRCSRPGWMGALGSLV